MLAPMSETNRQKIGHGLRISRLRARVSTEVAANHADVALNTLLRWERGESSPPADSLYLLAALYSTTTDAIGRDGGLLEATG